MTTVTDVIECTKLPCLPDPNGLGGPFAGVSGAALIVAGGTNFPGPKLWEGGTKKWHDDICVLAEGASAWTVAGKLPRPLAYGVSVSATDGVVCIGGEDGQQARAEVFAIRWDGRSLAVAEMPSLPSPVVYAACARLGNKVFVMGGLDRLGSMTTHKIAWVLDLDRQEAGWTAMEPWPGPPRILAVSAVADGSVFLCSGAEVATGSDGKPVRTYLKDAYRYTPGSGWQSIAAMPRAAVAAPSPAVPCGPASFLLLGGDDGTMAGHPPSPDHPGFPRTILRYRLDSDTWEEIPGLADSSVTIPTVEWGGRVVLPSGETRPAMRSPDVIAVRVRNP